MPDLIYNVKFEIDKASADKVGQIVDASNSQDIKALQKEVERLNQVLKENTVENGKVSKSVKQKILAYKEEVANLKLLDTKINKSIRVYGEFSQETSTLVTGLQRQSEAVDRTGGELLQLANASDRTTGEIVALTNAVSTGNRAMVAGANRAREMGRAQIAMGGQIGSTNKTFAAGNQAVFSFSDLIQDSTQFSYGFAQGMRAIGNNIGFTAELLAVMSVQAKESGQSLGGSLLASLKGVTGVVLGLNVVVTIATVLLERFRKKAKEAKEQLDLFGDAAKLAIDDFNDSFEQPEVKIESLEKALDSVTSSLLNFNEEALKSPDRFGAFDEFKSDIDLSVARTDALNAASQSVSKELSTINEEGNKRTANERAILEAASDTLIKQIGQAKAQEQVNKVLKDVIQQRKDELEITRQRAELEGRSVETASNLSVLQKELSIIKETDEVKKISLEADLQRFKVAQDLSKKEQEIKDLNLTDDQERFLLQQSREEARLKQEIINTQESLNLKDQASKKELDIEKQKQADLKKIRNDAASVLKAKQAELNLQLFEARGTANAFEIEQKIANQQYKAELDAIEADKTLSETQKQSAERVALANFNKKILESEVKAEILAAQQKIQAQDMAIKGTQAVSALLQGLFGENKKIAIAEALVSTYFTAQKAYESQFKPLAIVDSPGRGIAAAAIAVSQGLARVAAIKSTNIGSGGGGAGRSGSSGTRSIGVGANTRFLPTAQQPEEDSFRAFGESVNFTPNAPSFKLSENIIVEQNVKGKDLALVVRAGNKELKSSQVIG